MKSIRTTLTPLLLGALLVSSASAQAGEGQGRAQDGGPDKKSNIPEQILALFDQNGDGMLDDRECAAAREAIMERRQPGSSPGREDDGARRPSDQTRREAARSDAPASSDKLRSDKLRSDKLRSDKVRKDKFRRDQASRKGATPNRSSRDRAGRGPSRRAPVRQRQVHRGPKPAPKVNRQGRRGQTSPKKIRSRR